MDVSAALRGSHDWPMHPGWRISEPRLRPDVGDEELERAILREVVAELRRALSVLAVATSALRRQNADQDVDVAEVLERYASDRLDLQREKLETLLARNRRTR